MRPHLPDDELHAYADEALSSAQRAEIAQHLLACLICRAALGEAEALRARAQYLLAVAAPRGPRRRLQPASASAAPMPRRRRISAAAAAAVLLAGATSVATWQGNAGGGTGTPRLATAAIAPAILARSALLSVGDDTMPGDLLPDRELTRRSSARSFTLASSNAMPPRIVTPMMPVTAVSGRRMRVVDPMVEVDPAEGWQTTSWAAARAATRGAVAHLAGFPVSTVRIQESGLGGRPTAMVRQTLRDGRAVWIIEGAEAEIENVAQLLAASGLAMSTPRRARPDYIGSDDAPQRIIRMVAVAAYLPVDSLNALAGERLRLE